MVAPASDSAAAAPRYAPEDPTLPKPWKGLVDGKTGYLYYWNPDTNVTQYERPKASSNAGSAASRKSPSVSISSSVQVHQSSQAQRRDNGYIDDDERYTRGSNGGSKLAAGTRGYQSARAGSDHLHSVPNGAVNAGHGGSAARGYGSGAESGLSAVSYRRKHEITATGDDVPPPFTSFEATGLPSEILREVYNAGFSAPTPIQAQSWPIALQGRDIVAIAKTGSGKTLGYLIPSFMHLKKRRNNPQLGPTVLVLSPTRELATQIQAEAVKFGKSSRLSCTCLYGGAPKGPQLRDLDRGVDIVVATPGRLNDILEMRRISLSQISYLVLDEADRMLDMGFEPQIRKIVKAVPTRRQTLMYTATWPKEVRKIAADLLVEPVQVNIGNVDELVANKAITQVVEVLSYMEKQRRLEQILRSQEPGSKIIIFCSTKKMCDQLSRSLTRQFGAAAIHGDKSQGERDYVLNQFRSGRSPVLVATDVAARGLDIKDIRIVINFDFPTGVEDYVHRIGRTGRAGATGLAYTFFSEQDAKYAADLIKVLEGANQKVPVEIRDMALRGGGGRARSRWGSSGGFGGRGGGRYNSGGLGGRDGGRGNFGITPSTDRGGGRFAERGSRDRYSRNVDAPVSYMVRAPEKLHSRSRSRSRSRSPNRWVDHRSTKIRSRSHSADRAPPLRLRSPVRSSFHKVMAEKARSPPYRTYNDHSSRDFDGPIDPLSRPRERSRSPPNGVGPQERGRSKGFAHGPRSFPTEEEEEEGMIHADD